jgi:GNAT superfamily N-acetyltransferase
VIELRRMFVHAPFRRRGIGAALVHTLLGHCRARAVPAVELWTAPAGMGAALYRACGFRLIARPPGPLMLSEADYWPDPDEIRMRYDLGAHDARGHAPLHL